MTIENWLDRATRGLAAESAARVRQEIGEHNQAALAQSGATADSALADLGDPAIANREYRKQFLTAADALFLKRVTDHPIASLGPVCLMLAAFFPVVLLAAVLRLAKSPDLVAVGGVVLSLAPGVVLLAVYRLPFSTTARGRTVRAVKWFYLIAVLVIADPRDHPWMNLPLLGLQMYNEWQRMTLRRKLPLDQWPKSLYI